MIRVDFRRVFVISGLTSLVIVYPVLWARMISRTVERTGADFIAFYAAGRIAQNEGPGHVYDLDLQRHYEEQVVGFAILPEHISPYLHPPFVVPIAQLVSGDNFIFSFILWNLVMLAFLVGGTIPLLSLFWEGLDRKEKMILLASILLFYPSFVSLINGQDSAILYLGGCLWLVGLLKKKDWLAGLGLTIMAVRPHIALPLALPFLFRRREVWWWFLLDACLLGGLTLAYAGVQGTAGFLQILLVSGGGVNYHTGEINMLNLIGLLERLLPAVSPNHIRWFGWGAYAASLISLCVLWARRQQLGEKEFSLAVLLSLFTAPHFHFHDFVLLIVPIACLMLTLRRELYMPAKNAVLLPLIISLALLFSYFTKFLKDSISYIVMLFLLLALWIPGRMFLKKGVTDRESP